MRLIQSSRLRHQQSRHLPSEALIDPISTLIHQLQPEALGSLDFFRSALQQAQAIEADGPDLTFPGRGRWDGQPLWLETPNGWPVEEFNFEGVLVTRLPGPFHHLLLALFIGEQYWTQAALVRSGVSFLELLQKVQPTDPLYPVLCVLSNLDQLTLISVC